MLHRAFSVAGLAVAAVIAAASGADTSRAQELKFFRIGTGSTAGTYFPIGSLIASTISNPPGSRACDLGGSCGVPGLIAGAQSSFCLISVLSLLRPRTPFGALRL